jgi:O-antigen ligase
MSSHPNNTRPAAAPSSFSPPPYFAGINDRSRATGAPKFWVITVLVSAMLATASLSIFDTDRTWTLGVQYLVWALAFVGVTPRLKRLQVIRTETPSRRTLISFLVAFAISHLMVWNADLRTDMTSVLWQAAALMFMTVAFFTMALVAKVDETGPVLLATCHVIFALCAISVVGDFSGLLHYEGGVGGRYFGFLGDQVAWAITLPIVVYFCSGRFILALLAAAILALTASRAPALCMAAALVLLMFADRGHRARHVLLVGLLLVFIALSGSLFQNLFGRLGDTAFLSNDRLATARLGLRLFHESPIFGLGYNAQGHFFPMTSRRALLGEWSTQTSTFVQMLAEGGLLLFAAYASFVIACTIGGLAILKQARASDDWRVVGGAVTWLLAMLWVNQSAGWFLVGSYIGPLVFGMAGILSGYWARILFARRLAAASPTPR